jgi:hypothetical protein
MTSRQLALFHPGLSGQDCDKSTFFRPDLAPIQLGRAAGSEKSERGDKTAKTENALGAQRS